VGPAAVLGAATAGCPGDENVLMAVGTPTATTAAARPAAATLSLDRR
jgi:hypothetical protein